MQLDGNLVLYARDRALWQSATAGHPGARAVLQSSDQNLVVYDANNVALWASRTTGSGAQRLVVQDDGNMPLYTAANRAVWSTNTSLSGANGPQPFANASIADNAESHPNGESQGQCIVFVFKQIVAAGGPQWAFGLDTSRYQAQWADRAVEISSVADARRGDIIQWGGGAGGSLLHTAIVTQAGPNPSLIDSNWGNTEQVGRGPFSSRNLSGSTYRIWRVGRL